MRFQLLLDSKYLQLFKRSIAENSWFVIPFLVFQIVSLYVVPFGDKTELFLSLHPQHNRVLDTIFTNASAMVEWWGWVAAAIIALFVKVRYGIYAVFTLLLSGLWALILKHEVYVNEMRPSFNIDHSLLQLVDGVNLHTHHSFPSGHTIAAFSIFTVLTMILSKKYKPFGLLFFMVALIVGYSRIYLNQHYPVDVVAGSAVGFISCFLVFQLSEIVFNKLALNWAEKSFLSLFTPLG